jgi:hypothetical protein
MRRLVVTCLLFAVAFSVHAETRVALVIGNGAYEHAPHLPTPVHDATDVAAALQKLQYSVRLVTDARLSGMQEALIRFARLADGADQALIYYSGHAVEVSGVNYLLPVEVSLESESDVPLEAVSLPEVMGVVSRARHLALVVLDASRTNPLANSMHRINGARGADRGLAPVEPSGNLLVAYAARSGHTAADGTGRNSPYTKAILETLQEPGLEARVFWGKVHDRVLSATNNAQEPLISGALGAEALYLNPSSRAPNAEPHFPWPPPLPSALRAIPNDILIRRPITDRDHVHLGEVDAVLRPALEGAGYEFRYYPVPSGFALVAQIERIRQNGSPDEPRFDIKPPSETLSFIQYVRSLFIAEPGYFRVIAFIISSVDPAPRNTVTSEDAERWLEGGWVYLPKSISDMDYSKDYHCTALIYEFEKPEASATVKELHPGRLSADDHLVGSGIAERLGLSKLESRQGAREPAAMNGSTGFGPPVLNYPQQESPRR